MSTIDDELATEDEEGIAAEEPTYITDDGRELFEHFRFEADKGQQLLRVDKFLVDRMTKLHATAYSRLRTPDAS